MRKKISEWLSIQLAKNPGRMVLVGILIFNIVFFMIAAMAISALSLSGTEHMGFFESAYYTITMILDAGCIEAVVTDIGTSGVAIAITCLVIVLIGMITFTGAVIGYLTNFISDFIGTADLVPMGGAYSKTCPAMWDGNGVADAWEYTSVDTDADGLPDWSRRRSTKDWARRRSKRTPPYTNTQRRCRSSKGSDIFGSIRSNGTLPSSSERATCSL